MSSNPLRLRFLFDKYLENACSKQELEEFWELMAELSNEDLIDTGLKRIWEENEGTNRPENMVDWDAAYARLQQKIDGQKPDYARVVSITRRRLLKIAVAASVFFLVGLSYLVFREKSAGNTMQQAKNNSAFQTIHLPDGTVVMLNQQSKISYPVRFTGATREVYLTGEAFFDVAHNAEKPFIVHTGNYVTKVLGTAFNISAYVNAAELKVTVTRGKVQVKNTTADNVTLGVLQPGDQLVINKEKAMVVLKKVDTANVLSWRRTELKFENVTFENAAERFERHFGVTIQFKNTELRNCRFTGDFTSDSLSQVLEVVCTLTNAVWTKTGEGVILIEGTGCK
jgi:transmembrane sensor